MVDPTGVIGTIDVVATRLSDLAKRYHNFITNPQKCEHLSSQCRDFKVILDNAIQKVHQSTAIDSQKKDELYTYLNFTASVFDQAKQDLSVLQETLSDLIHNNSGKHSASSSSQTSTDTTSHSTIKKVREQLKNLRLHPRATVKSFTRVKHDTEILDSIENHLSNEKQYPLHISNYVDTIQSIGTIPSTFVRHFDKPPMPANCVVDFTIPVTTNGSISDLSHEAILKQEVISLNPRSNQASSSSNRTHTLQGTSANVRSICVWGSGGMGKSVALQALCRDEEMMRYFEDGIHFLTLGQEADVKDVITQLALCVRNAGFPSLEKEMLEMSSGCDVAKKGSSVFKGKRVLLIADDLWGSEKKPIGYFREIQSFASQMHDGMIVLSTRDETIARAADKQVHFDYLSPRGQTSKRILKAPLTQLNMDDDVFETLNTNATAALLRLLDLCGGWKLCLALVGSGLAEDIRDYGDDVELAVTVYVERLEEDNQFLSSEGVENYQSLETVTKSSLGRCRDWAKKGSIRRLREGDLSVDEMFRSLCVIEKQKWMNLSILLRLWKVGKRYGEMVVKQFTRMNLISRRVEKEGENEFEWVIRVHDRMIDVCCQFSETQDANGVQGWHHRLLESYFPIRKRVSEDTTETPWISDHHIKCREWWDERAEGKYIIRNLSRHLIGAGLWKELLLVVTDVRWTMRRRLEGGWIGLEDDFNRVLKEWEEEDGMKGSTMDTSVESSNEIEGLRILRDTIRDSWSQIAKECRRIGFQVFGRIPMRDRKNKVIERYLKSIEENGESPWLRPIIPILQRNDGRQISQVGVPRNCRKMIVSRDLKFAVTAARERLFITDLTTQETRCFATFQRNVNNFELLDNHLVLCVLASQQIMIWDWKLEKCISEIQIKSEASEGEWEGRYSRDGNFLLLFSRLDLVKISLGKGTNHGEIFETHKLITIYLKRTIERQHAFAWKLRAFSCVWTLSDKAIDRNGRADVVLTKYSEHITFETHRNSHPNWKIINLDDLCRQASKGLDIFIRINGISSNCKFVMLNWSWTYITVHAFSENGRFAIFNESDRQVTVWDIQQDRDITERLNLQNTHVTCAQFSEDNLYTALGLEDGSIHIFDLTTCALTGEPLRGHRHDVSYIRFCNDNRYLISGSCDGTVRWWDLQKDSFSGQQYPGHERGVTCITFSTDGQYVASGSVDRSIRIWDTVRNALVRLPITVQHNSARCLAFDETNQKLISGSGDDIVRIWDINNMSLVRELKIHSPRTTSVEFSPLGQHIITASKNGTVQIWNSFSTSAVHRQVQEDEEKDEMPFIVTPSPGGTYAVSVRMCNMIQVYETGSGQRIREFKIHNYAIIQCAMCSDASPYVFFASRDGFLRIWNFESECEPVSGLELDNVNFSDRYSKWIINLTEYASNNHSMRYCTCSQQLHVEVSSFLQKLGHVVEHSFWCSCGDGYGQKCKGAIGTDQERFSHLNFSEDSVHIDNHQLVDRDTFTSLVGAVAARRDMIAHGLEDGTVLVCRVER